MAEDDLITALSGRLSRFVQSIETREIIVAQGIECHEDEVSQSTLGFLASEIGSEFRTSSSVLAEYTNTDQRVHFIIRVVHNKDEYKNYLETEGVHVIYDGHSRYGRGACFDVYSGHATNHGDQWEQGTNNTNGLYRLGYPYVPVPLEDIEHHQYHFAPVPVEDGLPPAGSRHPHARRHLREITLPENLRGLVRSGYTSSTDAYYGLTRAGETNILLNAGWENTLSDPYDLGATNLRCKVFCHFGCSSRDHFWRIVRRPEYKGWVRPHPPTDRYAYFTTAPSDERTYYWLYYVLTYPHRNDFQPWWDSLQWAKGRANRRLRVARAGFQIY